MRWGLVLLAGMESVANAQAPTDAAMAQSLFEEGVALVQQGKYDEACPKLAESQRLDPGGGTLLDLAVCYEKQGRHATAYVTYSEALSVALKDGRKDRESTARERMAIVGPLLAKVVVKLSPALKALPGIEARIDSSVMPRVAWDAPMPVDLGEHTITVTAAHKRPTEQSVTLNLPSEVKTIEIASLEDEEVVAPPPPVVAPPPKIVTDEQGSPQRVAGWIALATGALALGIGSVFGVAAVVKRAEANRLCPNDQCTPAGARMDREVDSLAWGANIALITALAFGATGTILLLTAPKSERAAQLLRGTYLF